MRIAYISLSEIPSRSAHSIHIMRMCNAFSLNGESVTLIIPCYREDRPSASEIFDWYGLKQTFEIKYLRVPSVKGRSTYFYLAAFWICHRERFSLIYTREVRGAVWSAFYRIPAILESHGRLKTEFEKRCFRWLYERKRFLRHIVISSALSRLFDSDFPNTGDKRLVAHDGADSPADAMDDLGDQAQDDTFIVGYVGHLYQGRGLDLIKSLAQRIPSADFHIVGGLDTDIETWQNNFEGHPNIKLFGFLPYAEAEKIRQKCDVLIAPYQTGLQTFGGDNDTSQWMSPLKVFEYMAVGKPIVCSDLPPLREILSHRETALLCHPADVDMWEDSLRSLRENPELRDRLGSAARELFEKKYQWSSRAKKVIGAIWE
jgi:glycosyltransferase involved in cell wall biosynthesis